MQRHYIVIDPYVPVTPHSFNQPKLIGLKVVNVRSSNNIARRSALGLKFYSPKYTVRSKLDLTDIMRHKISSGLFQVGFIPKRIEKSPDKTLRVEIIRLKSKYEERLPSFKVTVEAALKAKCSNGGQNYSKTYGHQRQVNSAPASTFPNENLINEVLSETLKKMFEDEKLIACLAQ